MQNRQQHRCKVIQRTAFFFGVCTVCFVFVRVPHANAQAFTHNNANGSARTKVNVSNDGMCNLNFVASHSSSTTPNT